MMKITIENYEEFALDFIEGNLNGADRKQFESFLDAHPAIKQNIIDFELVVLPSFTPAMPSKSKLYQDNAGLKPVSFYIPRIAAAILTLILLSAILLQLNKQPDKGLVQQQMVKEKIEVLPDEGITPEGKPPIKINPMDAGMIANTSKKSPKRSELRSSEIKQRKVFSKTEMEEPMEGLTAIKSIKTAEPNGPIQTIAPIENIDIKPNMHVSYKIDHRSNFLLIENEEIQNDPFSKIGRLLARANLIPTGLQEEFEETSIREKMIPETYIDLK